MHPDMMPDCAITAILAHHWRHDVIRITALRPPGFDSVAGVDLPARFRGGLGVAMVDLGMDRVATGFDHAGCAPYQILFGPLDANRPTRPMQILIDSDPAGDCVVVELRLHGSAAKTVHAVKEALFRAMASGIALAPGPRARRVAFPMNEADIAITRHYARLPDEALSKTASLTLVTPARVRASARAEPEAEQIRERSNRHASNRPSATPQLEPERLLRGAIRRVYAMAPWMGLAYDLPGWSRADLHRAYVRAREAVDDLEIIDQPADRGGTMPIRWSRYSRNRGDVPIPMEGLVGSFAFRNRPGSRGPGLALVWPWLMLGQSCGLGHGAALGLGDYRFNWG